MFTPYLTLIRQPFDHFPNQVALSECSSQKTVTYSQLDSLISQIQCLFISNSIKERDTIVILGENSIMWCATFLAANFMGVIVVPLDFHKSAADIEALYLYSDAKLLVCTSPLPNHSYSNKIKLIDFSRLNISSQTKGCITINESICDDDIYTIIYTSGTTANPKGVMLSYKSAYLNLEHALQHLPLKSKDTLCSFLPFIHCFGNMYNFLYPLAIAAHIVILDCQISVPILINSFKKYQPNVIFTVPIYVEKIFHLAASDTSKDLQEHFKNKFLSYFGGRLRTLVISGASIDNIIEQRMFEMHMPFCVGYGMTECGPAISFAPHNQYELRSAGFVADHIETKVLQTNKGNIGELLVRGDSLFKGYYKDLNATNHAFDLDGWFHTGDIVKIVQENGKRQIFIVGRCKNLILNSNGENVYPEEIEVVICKLEYVLSALVVSQGNALIAKVVFAPSLSDEEKEALSAKYINQINSSLPKHLRISKIEVQNSDFMRTKKGSIKRNLYN